jgi:hypothetical protein
MEKSIEVPATRGKWLRWRLTSDWEGHGHNTQNPTMNTLLRINQVPKHVVKKLELSSISVEASVSECPLVLPGIFLGV